MTEKRCFFGSHYSGQQCKCGWSKDMIKEVPKEYVQNGDVKFYQINNYAKLTVYGCSRAVHVEKKSKSPPKHMQAGKFAILHDSKKVETRGDVAWPKMMEEYLNNALVEKEGPNLTCIGVTKKQPKGVCVHVDVCVCVCGGRRRRKVVHLY